MLVRADSRSCFGLEWYDVEAEAAAPPSGTVNGGFLHGMPCGRAPEFDTTEADGRKLFARRIP